MIARRAALGAFIVALVAGACARSTVGTVTGSSSPSVRTPPTAGSGVEGVVEAGPTCPVEREGRPCPPRRVGDATVTAKTTSGRAAGADRTDADGRFRIPLPPGAYDVSASSPGVFGCDAARANVSSRGYTRVAISCDTGIR